MDDKLGGKKTLKVTNFLDNFQKDDIKRKIDIVSLFKSFGVNLTKKGKSYTGICPFHKDSNPSLSVDNTKGLYNCFGCGESGDHFSLVEKLKGYDFKMSLKYLKEFAKTGAGELDAVTAAAESAKSDALGELASKINRKASETKARTGKTGPDKTKQETNTGLTILLDEQKTEDSAADEITEQVDDKPPGPPETEKTQPQPHPELTLKTISDYYHKQLQGNRKAVSYLKSRGLENPEIFSRFEIGFADGSLLKKISNGQMYSLKQLGIVRETGREHFAGYVVFPIKDEAGETVGLYGRALSDKPKIHHLYLKGKHKGIFNRKASKVYDEIILTESIIDCLSLISLGYENVQSTYGTGGFTDEHLSVFKADRIKTIIIAFDSDEAGLNASGRLKNRLTEENLAVKIISPERFKDWNEALLAGITKKEIDTLISSAQLYKNEESDLTVEKHGICHIFKIKDISYSLFGIKAMFVSNLKVNIRAEYKEKKHRDVIDLYSARARGNYTHTLSEKFDVPAQRIENEINSIIDYLEAERDKTIGIGMNDKKPELSQKEIELAMEYLKNPDMFEELVRDMESLGYIGEELNKILIYLCASSRLMDDPLSVLILSESSSGKSLLVETVEKLMPESEVVPAMSLSDRSLSYAEDLLNKFLVLGEFEHSEVVEHQIREMLSRKELTRFVTLKDDKTGRMRSELIRTQLIVSCVLSSTRRNINPENLSRFFVINTDESRLHTKRIMKEQRQKDLIDKVISKKKDLNNIVSKHHAAQLLLKKLVVVNEYAPLIDFPDMLVRVRRDHMRFLNLIKSVCFLRQYQKEVKIKDGLKYIECDLKDYSIAYRIMVDGILASTLLEIPKSAVELYEAIREMVKTMSRESELKAVDISFTQRQVREHTKYGHSWIKQNLRILIEYEYLLVCRGGGARSKGFYKLNVDEEISKLDVSMIPEPAKLKELLAGHTKN